MATVSKSSLKVTGGGEFNIVAQTAGTTVYTTASDEYAEVTLTNFWLISGTTTSINITLGSTVILQIGSLTTGQAATVVKLTAVANGATTGLTPVTFKVPPSTAFIAVIGSLSGSTAAITGVYTVFKNT